MLIISYDIKDTKVRAKFSRMLMKNGCIRLQFSVYEFNQTSRMLDNIRVNIQDKFSRLFTNDDSVVIFEVNDKKIEKYGNAIHRDSDIIYFS